MPMPACHQIMLNQTLREHRIETSHQVKPTKDAHTTVIIGDSIIKNIQGLKLGKAVGARVVVKSFPGAAAAVRQVFVRSAHLFVIYLVLGDLINPSLPYD